MKMLTYHHIQEKRNGGRATVENGALLSAENHQWFNRQSLKEQARMNMLFQKYKHSVDCGIEFVDDLDVDFSVNVQTFRLEKDRIKSQKTQIRHKHKKNNKKKFRQENQRIKKEHEDR